MIRQLLVLIALFLAPAVAHAQTAPPTYAGEVCLNGSTVTVSVTATPTATAILIYPTPPGGGYYMTNDGSGNYTASFNGLSTGSAFSFRLVVQAPNQYEYPAHTVTLEQGCTPFASAGGGGGGGGGDDDDDIDSGDFGEGGLPHARAFRHDVRESNGDWAVLLETGQPASPLPSVTRADLRYRIGDGPMQTASMSNLGGFIWGRTIPGISAGDIITYSFVQTVGIEPVDSAWFQRTVGEEAPAIPDFPLETIAAIRFRDRHENEWRFDHYPAGYDVGRSFDLRIIDHGNRLDFELTTAPEVPVGAIDIKWYNQAGEVGFCDRNISAISQHGGRQRLLHLVDQQPDHRAAGRYRVHAAGGPDLLQRVHLLLCRRPAPAARIAAPLRLRRGRRVDPRGDRQAVRVQPARAQPAARCAPLIHGRQGDLRDPLG
ncbi:MAG: hypothetical protein R3B67_12090 [Phycisphaerales bacterium]